MEGGTKASVPGPTSARRVPGSGKGSRTQARTRAEAGARPPAELKDDTSREVRGRVGKE